MELIVSDGIDISGPDDEKWMLLRKQFVENQGWMQVDGTDHDRYDRDPNTRQLVYKHCSKIMVGMRITPVETCLESLSLEMMGDSYGMRSSVADYLGGIEDNVSIFDITRMVADNPKSRDEYVAIKQGIPKMLGAAFKYSMENAQDKNNILWMYATTPEFYDVLIGMGIEQRLICSGYASDEDARNNVITYFCCTDPRQSFDALKNDDTLNSVNHGLGVNNPL